MLAHCQTETLSELASNFEPTQSQCVVLAYDPGRSMQPEIADARATGSTIGHAVPNARGPPITASVSCSYRGVTTLPVRPLVGSWRRRQRCADTPARGPGR